MELYVIRHGIAESAAAHAGADDARALTKNGREKVRAVAAFLKKQGACPTLVLSSPFTRALETAEILREGCPGTKETVITGLLKPDGLSNGGSYDPLVDYLNGLDVDSVAIVGHEPFLSGFVSYCLSRGKMPFVRMKKAGVAAIACTGPLEPGACELVWLVGPAQVLPE